MAVQFTNYASTTLVTPVALGQTQIVVANAAKFPQGSGWYYLNLISQTAPTTQGEIVKVTSTLGNTLTVTRGVDGTTQQTFFAGDIVEHRLNAAALQDLGSTGSVSTIQSTDGSLLINQTVPGTASITGVPFGPSGAAARIGMVPPPPASGAANLNLANWLCEYGYWAQLPTFGPSGPASHAPGVVPDPGSTAGASRYLCESGGWAVPSSNVALPTGTGVAHVVNGAFVSPAAPVNLSTGDVTGNLAHTHLNGGTNASTATFWRGDDTWSSAYPETVATNLAGVDNALVNDCTTPIQNEINRLANLGGGRILFPPGRYRFAGTITLFGGVTLQGLARGPFDINANPATSSTYPTLCCTQPITGPSSPPFITQGNNQTGAQVCDLMFYYPNQNLTTAASPLQYGPTIQVGTNGSFGGRFTIKGCTFINGYDSIILNGPRNHVQDCNVGGYHSCIDVNDCEDYTMITNIWMVPWHDYTQTGFPANIDTWCTTHKKCLIVRRCDALMASNIGCQGWFIAGVSLEDNLSANKPSGFGWISGLDIDDTGASGAGAQYGIICSSTNAAAQGFNISNFKIGIGVGTSRQTDVYIAPGGLDIPCLSLANGSIRNGSTMPFGAFNIGASNYLFYVNNVYGIDRPGVQPTVPGFPNSGVAVANSYPYTVQMMINTVTGATITDVLIDGISTGGNRGAILVPPLSHVQITWSGTRPTWQWYST